MLIGHSNIRKNDTVVEIGAGSGVITTALSKRCKRVIALEPDSETAQKLRENLTRFGAKNVEVIEKSFQDYDFPSEPYKVFSNPPFRYSSELIRKLLSSKPKSLYLILQKNYALKLIPTDRHYTSQLGHLLQQTYDVKIRLPLKRTDFTPPPAVETVLFEAKLRELQKPVCES